MSLDDKPNVVIVVAAVRDLSESKIQEQMKLLMVEQLCLKVGENILQMPSALAEDDEQLETTAERALFDLTRYRAEKMVFLSQGAILPCVGDQIVTFFLAVNATQDGAKATNLYPNIHRIPIIHIGPWISKRKVMVAPTVWAGMYLRIAHLTTNPMHGTIQ